MQKITPFLWFNDNAEEAAKYYVSIFKNAKITSTMPGPNGTVMGLSFTLDGQEFQALNGGPQFKFTEAISLFVRAETQPEIDELWDKLSAGGEKSRCGWLKDKFGLSWQIIPPVLGELLGDKDRVKAQRVMMAMLKMNKIVIQELKDAYHQS
jgi:predicted 3-demethylubiquinone-9 3-methyltransferase (glyoxalase superfamily)